MSLLRRSCIGYIQERSTSCRSRIFSHDLFFSDWTSASWTSRPIYRDARNGFIRAEWVVQFQNDHFWFHMEMLFWYWFLFLFLLFLPLLCCPAQSLSKTWLSAKDHGLKVYYGNIFSSPTWLFEALTYFFSGLTLHIEIADPYEKENDSLLTYTRIGCKIFPKVYTISCNMSYCRLYSFEIKLLIHHYINFNCFNTILN